MNNITGGNVVWKIDVDDSALQSGFSRAQEKVDRESNAMDKQTRSMSDSIAASFKRAETASFAFAGGLAAIGTAAISALGFGVKMAADIETMTQGFITLLGSTEKANAAIEMIKRDAASTPFEVAGLINANQLITSITKDAGRSEKLLLNVGKALSAMGKGQPELDRIIINLQQIGAVGHASMVDIKQFAFAGIPIFDMLKKKLEETTVVMVDNSSKISDKSAKLMDLKSKLAIAQQQMSEFNDKTKQSTRMMKEAQIAKYTSQIGSLTGEVGSLTSANGKLSSSQNELDSAISDGKITFELLEEMFNQAGSSGISFTKALSDIGKVSEDVLKRRIPPDKVKILSEAWKIAGDDVAVFNKQLDKMGAGSFIDTLDTIGISVYDIMKAFDSSEKSAGQFADAFKNQAGTFNQLFSNMKDNIGIAAAEIVKQTGVFDMVKQNLSAFVDFIGNNTPAAIELMKNAFAFMHDNAVALTGALVGGLMPAIISIAISIGAMVIAIAPWIAIGALLAITIQKIVEQMGGWDVAMQKVRDIFNEITAVYNSTLKPMLDNLWNTIKIELIPQLQILWTHLSPILIPALKVLAMILAGLVYGALLLTIHTLTLLISFVADSIAKFNAFVDFLKTIPQTIQDAFSTVYEAITRPFKDAYNYIRDVAGKIKDAMNNINPFQRHSPSLVDNVKRGMDVIKGEFGTLESLKIPMLSYQMQGGFNDPIDRMIHSPSTDSMGSVGSSNKNVSIHIDEVNNAGDIDRMSREMAFKLAFA